MPDSFYSTDIRLEDASIRNTTENKKATFQWLPFGTACPYGHPTIFKLQLALQI